MRIAYVINSVEGGGAASPVPAIAEVLRGAGAEVAIFALTRRDGRGLVAMRQAGLDVRVREGGDKDHWAALAWLDRELRAWRATHLWTSLTRATLLGQIVGQRRRLPVTSWQHAAYLKPWNGRLLRWRQRRSQLWIADSEAVRRLTHQRLGVPEERLMLWPIFRVDADALQAAAWRPGEPVRIGSLGRLHPVKGFDVLDVALASLASATPYRVAIGGEGSARAALAAGDRIALEGYVDSRSFLARQHLYVQPSRSEGLCVAAHEAMQAGLPVIASTVGELQHSVIPGETGWLVPPGDPRALAAALREALGDPARLAAMGAAARGRVLDRFGRDKFDAAGQAIVARMAAFRSA